MCAAAAKKAAAVPFKRLTAAEIAKAIPRHLVVSFPLAMLSSVMVLSIYSYVWLNNTPLQADAESLFAIYEANGLGAAASAVVLQDAMTQNVALTMAIVTGITLASWTGIRGEGEKGSDPGIVDSFWSVTPFLYTWVFYFNNPSPRGLIMTTIATVWGFRLSRNAYIKGVFFTSGTDHRWNILREWFGTGIQWEFFNLLFVINSQLWHLFGQTTPAYIAMLNTGTALNNLDYLATFLCFGCIAGEALSDHTMFVFQEEKYRRLNAGEELGKYSKGYCDVGLYGKSRHAAYFFEVSLWFCFYLFSVAATGEWLNWSFTGACSLWLLFVAPGGSVDISDAISATKYPTFPDYRKRVNRFVPWFSGPDTAKAA